MKRRFVGTAALFVVVLSAWAGIAMSGMERPWALAFSAMGGTMAMFVGMVMAGLKYHDDMLATKAEAERQAKETTERMEDLGRQVVSQRRDFGVAAVMMAKTIADNVAVRIISRHIRSLPAPEHRDAALKEAQAMVAEEIAAYGEKCQESERRENEDPAF